MANYFVMPADAGISGVGALPSETAAFAGVTVSSHEVQS
jgi:hypothetical protein